MTSHIPPKSCIRMKPVATLLIIAFCLSSATSRAQTAEVSLRPAYVDLSSADAQGAVLITLSDYPADDVRFRLYRSSSQYNCWDPDSGAFITSSSYAMGPKAYGTPSSETSFWVIYTRGSNESADANYRDRLGPAYDTNFQTVELPAATAISNAYHVTHNDVDLMLDFAGLRLVVLAWDAEEGGQLIAAASTDPQSGHFSVAAPVGTVLKRIELRTISNDLHEAVTGQWPRVQQVVTPAFNPAPGIFRGSTSVEITTTTPDATIYYTLNGTDPDESATPYIGHISIDASATLKAIAYKDGFAASEVMQGNYRILNDEHHETFDAMEHTTTTYRDASFTGQDGSVWQYVQCAGALTISGQAITLGRNRTPQAYVESGVISNGIGTLDFNFMQAFSTGVNLDVYVNGLLVGQVTSSDEQGVVKHSGMLEVNVAGEAVIRFSGRENAAGQVVIDDVIWDGYTGTSTSNTLTGRDDDRAFANIFCQAQTLTIDCFEHTGREFLLEVFDLNSRRLMRQTISDEPGYSQHLDLPAGIYVVRLSDHQKAQTERIFIGSP